MSKRLHGSRTYCVTASTWSGDGLREERVGGGVDVGHRVQQLLPVLNVLKDGAAKGVWEPTQKGCSVLGALVQDRWGTHVQSSHS